MRQGIAHPVNPTALVGRVEDPACGGAQPLVIIGDHQLNPTQASVGQRPQEVGPECLGLGRAGGDAQNLALAIIVDCDGHYHGTAHDPATISRLYIGASSQR